jgi:hypothetical protein
MSETHAVVHIVSSGSPSYLTPARDVAPSWPSGSMLLSAVMNPVLTFRVPPRSETVFLTQSHQRIMDRALRRSLRIIA